MLKVRELLSLATTPLDAMLFSFPLSPSLLFFFLLHCGLQKRAQARRLTVHCQALDTDRKSLAPSQHLIQIGRPFQPAGYKFDVLNVNNDSEPAGTYSTASN